MNLCIKYLIKKTHKTLILLHIKVNILIHGTPFCVIAYTSCKMVRFWGHPVGLYRDVNVSLKNVVFSGVTKVGVTPGRQLMVSPVFFFLKTDGFFVF